MSDMSAHMDTSSNPNPNHSLYCLQVLSRLCVCHFNHFRLPDFEFIMWWSAFGCLQGADGFAKKTQSNVAHINSQKKRLGTFTCVNNQSLESQPMFHTLSLIITYIVELIQQNPSKFLHKSSKKSPVESDTTHEEVLFLTWSVLSPSPWRHNCHPNVGNFITHLTLPFFVQCDDPQEMIQWKQLSRTCKL